MGTRTYHLAPNDGYPPGGSLELGRILTDPTDPSTCLNRDPISFTEAEMQKDVKKGWVDDNERSKKKAVGVWATFLQAMGVRAEASVHHNNQRKDRYSFETLETIFVDPTLDRLKECLKASSVQDYMTGGKRLRPVYMITGVKIARQSGAARTMSKEFSVHLSAGIDGTPTGASVALGPQINLSSSDSRSTTYRESSDFVFAYRIRELFYERGRPPVLSHRPFNKGTLYMEGNEEDGIDALQDGNEKHTSVFIPLDLAENDWPADSSYQNLLEAVDEADDEKCRLVFGKTILA